MKYNRGVEILMEVHDTLNVIYGSIDKDNPKSIYIRFSGWGNPIDYSEYNDYNKIIRKFDKKLRSFLFNEVNGEIFNNKLNIVDFDMRESGIINNKSSFMSCEITLSQINNYTLDDKIIDDEINYLVDKILKNIFYENVHFKFYKEKKVAKEELFKP